MGALYRINFPNGKGYIGITVKTSQERFQEHCRDARRKSRRGQVVHSAIRAYGEHALSVTTLVICDDWGALCEMEKRAIIAYRTKTPNGYNLTDGGEGIVGQLFPQEYRSKLSLANVGNKNAIGNKNRLGKPHDAEVIARMSEMRKGRKKTESHKDAISLANVTWWSLPERREAHREAMRLAWARRKARSSEQQQG